MPHALRVSEETGLDPRLIIAQAAQETGWGKSAPGNNYFGIKSHGKAGGNTMATNEVIDGKTVRINDSFRGYQNMGESVDGYGSFLKENPRYKPMLAAKDLDGQLVALGRSGYATDPNYERSVGLIARSIELPQRQAEPPKATAPDRAAMRAQWPEFASVPDAQLDALLGNEKLGFGAKLRPMGVGPV
ncbi:glucosaminidase domain-containing protein [Sulfitobacter sp. OXR-159]|uniref:glycoside hydrolase family 73 protein n=1 Tax=Sulfitobacter sp. OXR-159 TaxID=3100174 RepID=UPI002AC89B98|nr:glucosaminidase domain-containing protein [Sulfitobacter sp. OXR-159]WPZ30766.1 glucosaminidase domain-containing protein [Sulfitobacter sp. OXR-159]WPZ30867.1 glucosaminidase domain-containing protein [Sulfitobacter sp. OXR-159]